MTLHNQNIKDILNDFLTIDKPCYAVLIKGVWGSGKSYFVNQWLKEIKDQKPIYLSLYGKSSPKQIDDEIKRIISPILHNKYVKGAGKILQIAASATFRCNIEFDNDGEKGNGQLVCSIDPKALMRDDSEHVNTKRLIVFDDLERSNMKMTEVMGYINYYVEHAGCHVIILGDDDKASEKDRNYQRIKEKTIGKELEIEAETEDAFDNFVKQFTPKDQVLLKKQRQLIIRCFMTTQRNNLRILKQSMEDYCRFRNKLSDKITSLDAFKIIDSFILANFVVVYTEYKSGATYLKHFNKTMAEELRHEKDNESEKKVAMPLHNIVRAYEKSGLWDSHRVMVSAYVELVTKYLLKGERDEELLMIELGRYMKSPWEQLGHYSALSNNDLKKCIGETAEHLESADFVKVDYFILACCKMLAVIHKKLAVGYSTEKVVAWCKDGLEGKFFKEAKTYDALYAEKVHVYRCMNYYMSDKLVEEKTALSNGIEDAFKKCARHVKNAITKLLESLNDDNINELYKIYGSTLPDHSTGYSDSAIFSQVEPEKFVRGFIGLNNESKNQVVRLIRTHYHDSMDHQNPGLFVKYFKDDLNTLPEIIKLLVAEVDNYELVDKDNINQLAECLKEYEEKIRNTKQIFD